MVDSSFEPWKGHDEILHPVIKKVPGNRELAMLTGSSAGVRKPTR